MPLLCKKVKGFDFRKEKKSYFEVTKIYGKNKSSMGKIIKKEKENWASFAVTPQIVKS